jgi:hypothetical protein
MHLMPFDSVQERIQRRNRKARSVHADTPRTPWGDSIMDTSKITARHNCGPAVTLHDESGIELATVSVAAGAAPPGAAEEIAGWLCFLINTEDE